MKHPLLVVLLGVALTLPAWASELDEPVDLTLFPTYKAQLQLAEAGSATADSQQAAMDANERAFAEFRPPFFTANKLHKWLGIGSITLATLAIISPKDDDGGGHPVFGAAAAALGAGAVVSGLVVHGDDVGFSQGISDPDNLHAIFATLGAAGYIAAASVGGEEEDKEGEDGDDASSYHALLGITGYTSMLIGIRIAW